MVEQTKLDLQQLLSEARLYEKEGDWKSAIRFYKSALILKPNHLESHHNLAISLRQDNQIVLERTYKHRTQRNMG